MTSNGAFTGSATVAYEGGGLWAFAVDEANLEAFEAGEAFFGLSPEVIEGSGELSFSVGEDEAWWLVVANPESVAGSVVGDITVSASPGEGTWTENPSVSTSLRLLPGGYVAVEVTPAE